MTIKTWQETVTKGMEACDCVDEMQREINELRAELVALKAPRPPQDYFASKQAPLLHELLHQVIHGDFMGDNQDDLNLALRARKQLEELCKSFEKLKGKK